ncbi:unnamed protein product [Cylindrotheca closterium]|uniref:Uncharacterized protein n=1 Tax=Cylindrotheca closterium TaxID=2856 RepID=A0AAD2CR72_9STRA|nr:unnamed protein product [Cylindrotheca closterium]
MPPSMPSICHCGDWSMEHVFDAYFKMLSTGDQYLGQILAGKDPNLASFKVLPPHWNVENPLQDLRICTALLKNFWKILEDHGEHGEGSYDPTGLLLCCLACMVWHSKEILDVINSNPSHKLSMVPLFQPDSNLEELRALVSTDPTPGVMTTVTGIPPHIEVACQLKNMRKDLLDLIKATEKNKKDRKAAEKEFREQITNAVQESIEQENVNNGNV